MVCHQKSPKWQVACPAVHSVFPTVWSQSGSLRPPSGTTSTSCSLPQANAFSMNPGLRTQICCKTKQQSNITLHLNYGSCYTTWLKPATLKISSLRGYGHKPETLHTCIFWNVPDIWRGTNLWSDMQRTETPVQIAMSERHATHLAKIFWTWHIARHAWDGISNRPK